MRYCCFELIFLEDKGDRSSRGCDRFNLSKMGKRRLKPGDQVEFTSHDEKCKPFKQIGIVRTYVYPDFHPDGYIEIVDDDGNLILYGNAGDGIQKSKRKGN